MPVSVSHRSFVTVYLYILLLIILNKNLIVKPCFVKKYTYYLKDVVLTLFFLIVK